jgi:hypothetical protein
MNITETETPVRVVAKTCGSKDNNRMKVTYAFVDSYHSLCIDKKDIMYAELEACEKLLKYAVDESDKKTIQSEIAESKMVFGSFDLALRLYTCYSSRRIISKHIQISKSTYALPICVG